MNEYVKSLKEASNIKLFVYHVYHAAVDPNNL